MTTPDITPADRAAVAAFTLASGEFVDEDLLAQHFAAWRVKCVANEHRLREALEKILANCYRDDDVINRHPYTTVSCEALRNAQAALAKTGGG